MDKMEVGLCLTNKCTNADAEAMIDFAGRYVGKGNATLHSITASCTELDRVAPDAGSVVACVLLSILILLVLIATAIHPGKEAQEAQTPMEHAVKAEDVASGLTNALLPVSQHPQEEEGQAAAFGTATVKVLRQSKFVMAFSLITNFEKMMGSPQEMKTDSLNGMRVISMLWIILGHTFLMPEAIAGYSNPEDVVGSFGAVQGWWFQIIVGAEIGVDTFFFLSGFLLCYLTMKDLHKLKISGAIIYRYLRLTPSLVFAMMFYYKISMFIGDGPFFARFQNSVFRRCDKSWWTEPLYIFNFYPTSSDDLCMGWTWYLGDDFIFFIITLPLMLLAGSNKRHGWIALVVICVSSTVVTGFLVLHYDLGVYVFNSQYTQYSFYAYSKPYTRIPAYLIGVGAAWLALDYDLASVSSVLSYYTSGERIRMHIANLVAMVLLVVIVVCPLGNFQDPASWGKLENLLFICFARIVWSCSLSVLTFSCMVGMLPQINRLLSLRMFVPLARLTYGAYLWHPIIIKWSAGVSTSYYYFDTQSLLARLALNSLLAFSCSAIQFLLVERPMLSLTILMIKGKKKEAPKEEPPPPAVARNGA